MPLFNISSTSVIPLAPKSKNGIQIYIRHEDRTKPLEHRIVLACCRYYTEDGTTVLNIVRQTRLSRNTIRKSLKALAKSSDVSKSTSGKWTASNFETGHKGFKVRLFPELSKYEYCVLALIRSWAKGKSSFVSQQGIATQLAVDPRTVYKAVKSLVENGWIERRGRAFGLLRRSIQTRDSQPTPAADDLSSTSLVLPAQIDVEQKDIRKGKLEPVVMTYHQRILKEAEAMMRDVGIPQDLKNGQLSLLDEHGVALWDDWKACFNKARKKHRPKKPSDPKHCGYYLQSIVKRITGGMRYTLPSAESMYRSELLDHLKDIGTESQLAIRIAAQFPHNMSYAVRKRLLALTAPLITDDLTTVINDAA